MHHKLFTLIVCLVATIATALAQTPPDNEIWYTTTDGKKAEFVDGNYWEENGSDFKIISHTYSNGKGVIRANNPIIEYGYVRCENTLSGLVFSGNTLETISFPDCTKYFHLDEDVWDYKFKNNKGLKSIKCRYSSKDGRCIVMDGNLIDFAPGGLTEYTIPKGVTSIAGECDYDYEGYTAFSHCTELQKITIPSTVTRIGDGAFRGCKGLTSIIMSDKVTEIGADAFAWCSNLKSVTVGNLYCLEYFSNLGVPDITFGGRNASSDGRCLFSGGTLERFVSTGLTSYDFPARLTNIGTEALNECKNLQSVTVRSHKAYDAFSKAGIPVSAFTGSYASADGRCLIIDGILVRFIATGLKSYDFPESITKIMSEAFYECKKLQTVTVANCQFYDIFKKAGIPVSAFMGSNASADGRYLIDNGTILRFNSLGLTSYDFPESVTKIEVEALYECQKLKSATVANSRCYNLLKKIGVSVNAFTGSNASSDGRCLIINGELTIFIGNDATEYAIPQNVTKISEGVFNNCSSLANITIPTGVTAIGNNQFSGCNALAAITCLAMTPPAISDLGIAETTVIYVPKDAIKEYKKDPNWEIYKKQIKAIK